MYGHGADPIHVAIDNLGFLAIVREEGVNAVIALDIDGKETTALVKSIAQNPLTREIEHVDFLTVKKGEKVEVEVPLLVEGEVAPGATLPVEGLEAGSAITAADVKLPENVELVDDPELLLVNVTFEEEADTESATDEEASTESAETADDEAAAEE